MADSGENKMTTEREKKSRWKGRKIVVSLARKCRKTKEFLHLGRRKKKSGASNETSNFCNEATPSKTYDDNIEEHSDALIQLSFNSSFKRDSSARRWLSSFGRTDPRWQIARFFDDLAQEGARNIEASGGVIESPVHSLLRPFAKASVFTVWRPTSFVAIRRMIAGEATGKGLEIKGKSAKTGKLSGYVPYLQISKEEHKKKVSTLSRGGRTRVFFASNEARDTTVSELKPLQNQMMNAVAQAKILVRDTAVKGMTPFSAVTRMAAVGLSQPIGRTLSSASGAAVSGLKPIARAVSKASDAATSALSPLGSATSSALSPFGKSISEAVKRTDSAASAIRRSIAASTPSEVASDSNEDKGEDEREWALTRLLFDMDDPSIKTVDDYAPECYGIELPDRLLWHGCVVDRDITRPEGSEFYTGRLSEPAFQDMNFKAIWKTQKNRGPAEDLPRVVLWQTSSSDPDDDPMDPRGLIMAHEEKGHVRPVVSDFDCFTVGTRGVKYETALSKEQNDLVRWEVSQIETVLDKQSLSKTRSTWTACWLEVLKSCAAKGFNPAMPRFGFGDAKSYAIMECAVSRLSTCGAVRHGAECFNYFFPQELDEEFLIVSDALPGNVPWKYVGLAELQEFLYDKIDEGFTFPLNPKWVLCDEGWKKIYDRLMMSDSANVRESLDIWFPTESGIRERIELIHERHPRGFVQEKAATRMSGTEAMDLATLALDQYLAFRRAKMKVRAVIAFNDLLCSVRKKNAAGKVADSSKDTNVTASTNTTITVNDEEEIRHLVK